MAAAASTSAGESRSLAPFTTQIRFCPELSTKIGATPLDTPGVVSTRAGIDAARREVLDIRRPEKVVAHARHHRHFRAAQARRHGLVRALAAEAQAELAPEDGFARTRKLVGVRDQVDIGAADHRNPRLMFHSTASLPPRYNPLMTR